MTPYKQLIKHDPANGKWGDCYRTAWGCLLDIPPEEIPHFVDQGRDDCDVLLAAWLKEQGLRRVCFPLNGEMPMKDALHFMREWNPDVYYLFSGSSVVANHVVVALNNKIIHDPAGRKRPFVGPASDGCWWIDVAVPLSVCPK